MRPSISTARTRRRSRRAAATPIAIGAVLALALGACGRSGTASGQPSSPATSASSSASGTAAPGTFGTLKGICGPGNAKGATARGVTDSTIRVAVNADPGNTAAPGLEQEFFDAGDGFVKWCNAAGGINGRKLVLDKLDAKLYYVGQIMIKACQNDFFMVGGGNVVDAAGVDIREKCKLGLIPGYVTSPQAVTAKLQVQPAPNPVDQFNGGALRLLTKLYPDVKTAGVGIGSSNLATIRPTGLKTQDYLQQSGIKVAALQEQPPIVTNYRPYMEQLKGDGAKAYYGISAQDPSPIVQAMKDVGYSPSYILYSTQFYGPQAVAFAKATPQFPPSYVQFNALPFELKDKYPVLQQVTDIVKAAVPNPKLTTFTLSAFSAWALFAQSATACGSNLTVDCVLQKAADHDDWTGGGLYPPHSIKDGAPASPCVALVRLTPNGFVYDEKATSPTKGDGPFNCDPANVKHVKSQLNS
jgi:ABC-type branched-subunit amino acid transport system substrate-binding protein